jgi:hypothetical protein
MQATSVSALEIARQAICDAPVQVGNQSPLTDDTAGRVFHAELHELVDQFWIFYAGMLRRLGEVLILGNLGVGIGLEQVGITVLRNAIVERA